MARINSIDDLQQIKEKRSQTDASNIQNPHMVRVKVALATCGIASGAKDIHDYIREELNKRGIPSVVSKTGCMCYCYAEPTIEIIRGNQPPVVFGYVTRKKVDEIIEKYILNGEPVSGIIPMNYKTVDE